MNQETNRRIIKTLRLDTRTIAAIAVLASEAGITFNQYVEGLFFSHGQALGKIPMTSKRLGELRGGDFTKPRQGVQSQCSPMETQDDPADATNDLRTARPESLPDGKGS